MEAGREMDALVAEKIFNWIHSGRFFLPPSDPPATKDNWAAIYAEKGRPNWLPYYSTSISAAWEVVEKMERFQITQYPKGKYYAGAGDPDEEGWEFDAEAPTAPLAICRVALMTMDEK